MKSSFDVNEIKVAVHLDQGGESSSRFYCMDCMVVKLKRQHIENANH